MTADISSPCAKARKNRTFRTSDLTKIILAVVFVALIFIPLIKMLLNIKAENITAVTSSSNFGSAVLNSITAALLSTAITIILAYFTALSIERSNIKFKSVFGILFVLPMLIPSISNGFGLIILFGNNGIITNLLGLNISIYGLHGIVIGSVLYSFPVAYLMFADVMKYEDSSPYEAAKVLGIGKVRQFTAITLPYLRKPLISIVFSIFTLIITDYGVPLMVGGKFKTIPVIMYEEVIGQLNFGTGSVYGCLLLIPAVVAFIIDLTNKDKGNSGFVTKPFENKDKPFAKIIKYTFCILISLFVILPIIAFLVLAFTKSYPNNLTFSLHNIAETMKMKAGEYMLNSLLIALLVSLIGVLISFATAYMTARMKSKTSRFLHLCAITSAAIPGLVLGLSYVLVFKGSFIYGTIAILVMVNIIHFISSPYLMMYNSFSKVNENLEAVGQTLGINRIHMIKDVFVPMCKSTLIEMFSYFFVNCMMTISAVSFLATTANKPVSLMINQFEALMQLPYAAVISLAILIINLLIKCIAGICKHKMSKSKKQIQRETVANNI